MTPGIELHVPEDLRQLYEVREYKHAAAILFSEFPALYQEICTGLRTFRFTKNQILQAGGNESEKHSLKYFVLWVGLKVN